MEDSSFMAYSNLGACYSAGGKLALTGNSNDTIIAFDIMRGEIEGVLKNKSVKNNRVSTTLKSYKISDIAWQNRGDKLVVLNSDGTLNIWN